MKDTLSTLAFILILGGILTSSLVVVDALTHPIIQENQDLKLKSSVLNALGISFGSSDIEDVFADTIAIQPAEKETVFVASNGQIALPFEGSGLWGPISGVLAMDSDLARIKGITIVHQEETPGLGSRIADAPFLNQFIDKQFSPELLVRTPGKSSQDNEVDSISGATMSSNAFVGILNSQFSLYRDLLKEKK